MTTAFKDTPRVAHWLNEIAKHDKLQEREINEGIEQIEYENQISMILLISFCSDCCTKRHN